MRIRDWSSDVCSSDLFPSAARARSSTLLRQGGFAGGCHARDERLLDDDEAQLFGRDGGPGERALRGRLHHHRDRDVGGIDRSEEHTSELQSLMRISYAVFCLNKKKKQLYSTDQARKQDDITIEKY